MEGGKLGAIILIECSLITINCLSMKKLHRADNDTGLIYFQKFLAMLSRAIRFI